MQLQIFKYKTEEQQMFDEIRTIDQEDGKILFCATDVAKMLGYSNPIDAVAKHCKYVVKCDIPHQQNSEKTLEVGFMPEGDVYRLIVRSQLPSAEKFEKWLFDEVVPAIRNKGFYGKIDRTALPNFIERYKSNAHIRRICLLITSLEISAYLLRLVRAGQ